MEQIDAESLEGAIQSGTNQMRNQPMQNQRPASMPANTQKAQDQPTMSVEEEIGFHKGSINTLVSERNELVKMIRNVEAIMNAHLNRLKELGVDIKQN